MPTFHERFYQLYEEFRDKDHKLGRTKFALYCGVTYGQINGWLNQKGEPESETMKKVAARNNVSVSWLTGETDIRKNNNFAITDKLPPAAIDELNSFLGYLCHKYKV